MIKKSLFQLVGFKIYAIMKLFQLVAMSIYQNHWEVFLEINFNQKTLTVYTSWVHWKNQCRLTVWEHAVLWNKLYQQYQHSTHIFVKNIFNPFTFSLLPETHMKTRGFLMFSGGIERDHCHEMVKSNLLFRYLFCYLFKFYLLI